MLLKKQLFVWGFIFFFCSINSYGDKLRKYKEVVLTNEDFKFGTYIIDRPGNYRLGEDISFNPNSPETLTDALDSSMIPQEVARQLGLVSPVDAYSSSFPLFTQFKFERSLGESYRKLGGSQGGGKKGKRKNKRFTPGGPLDARYDPAGFGLGFFAAIVIQADDVVLDLAGYTIEQSAEHALLQRFFAVIELAEQPFIPNQGPADFGDRIESASNVLIKNGTIGRSAHHGIHGNNNKNIQIVDVDFEGYEVAAVALNGVKGLYINNSNAENRKDVPILGTFSSAQFIKTYINELARNNSQTTLRVDGERLNVDQVKNALVNAINNVHEDIILDQHMLNGRAVIDENEHPDEYALFHNKHGVVDGNSYSFLVNPLGVAVNGFPLKPNDDVAAENIWLKDVHIYNQHAFINEVITLNQDGPVIDPVGAVFQTLNAHPDTDEPITVSSFDVSQAEYIGNAVANAQAFVAKAFLKGDFDNSNLDLSRLSINKKVLKWVEGRKKYQYLSKVAPTESDFLCNGDSMFHVNKGVIAFKIDGAKNVVMRKTSANDILNMGSEGSNLCGDYSSDKSHPAATLPGYGGAKTRAYTFSGSSNVVLAKSSALELRANAGTAVGVDMLTDSENIRLRNVSIIGAEAGFDGDGNYDGPNETPEAVGFLIGQDTSRIKAKDVCADLLSGFGGESIIKDESDSTFLRKICR